MMDTADPCNYTEEESSCKHSRLSQHQGEECGSLNIRDFMVNVRGLLMVKLRGLLMKNVRGLVTVNVRGLVLVNVRGL